jgi:hypothetical protein
MSHVDDVRANLAEVMTGVQDAIRQRAHELLGIPDVVGEATRPSIAAELIASDRTVVGSVENNVDDPSRITSRLVARYSMPTRQPGKSLS